MSEKKINFGDNNITIKEFDFNTMVNCPTIGLIAKRRTGKSFICRALLNHYKKVTSGVIISPTESDTMTPFYNGFFPDSFIHDKYSSELMQTIINRQKGLVDKLKIKYKQGKYFDPRLILLMDDCLADVSSWGKDPLISTLFLNGRHLNITLILTMQFLKGITPALRSNFDYIFLLAENNTASKEKLYKEFGGIFSSKEIFYQIFDKLTDNYGCMVINNASNSSNISDIVFHYKAPDFKGVKLDEFGGRQIKTFDKKNYDKNYKNKIKSVDLRQYGTKKNKPIIGVNKI